MVIDLASVIMLVCNSSIVHPKHVVVFVLADQQTCGMAFLELFTHFHSFPRLLTFEECLGELSVCSNQRTFFPHLQDCSSLFLSVATYGIQLILRQLQVLTHEFPWARVVAELGEYEQIAVGAIFRESLNANVGMISHLLNS